MFVAASVEAGGTSFFGHIICNHYFGFVILLDTMYFRCEGCFGDVNTSGVVIEYKICTHDRIIYPNVFEIFGLYAFIRAYSDCSSGGYN